jgi:hypothetical protein
VSGLFFLRTGINFLCASVIQAVYEGAWTTFRDRCIMILAFLVIAASFGFAVPGPVKEAIRLLPQCTVNVQACTHILLLSDYSGHSIMCLGAVRRYSSTKLLELRLGISPTSVPSNCSEALKDCSSVQRNLSRHKSRRLVRGGKHVKGLSCWKPTHANVNNLKVIPCANVDPFCAKPVSCCSINMRSVKEKTLQFSDFITSHDFDVVAITETWLGSAVDKQCIAELLPNGYEITHIPRSGDRNGGGVALVFRSGFRVKVKDSASYSHFEHMECSVEFNDQTILVCVIYRPPPSQSNGLRNTVCFWVTSTSILMSQMTWTLIDSLCHSSLVDLPSM